MLVPSWAKNYFTELQAKSISQKIQKIESHVFGELTVVVSRRSVPTLWLGWALSLAGAWMFLAVSTHFGGVDLSIYFKLFAFLAGAVMGQLLARSSWACRLLTPESDADTLVKRAALLYFYQTGVSKTPSKSGVLIYLSLAERQMELLVDEGISSRVSQADLDQVVQDGIAFIKKGDMAQGVLAALEDCEKLLDTHFHKSEEKQNELHEELVFVES